MLHRPLPPEATDAERSAAREELLKSVGESKTIIDLAGPPEAGRGDGELLFRCGSLESRYPAEAAAALDVRDKEELAALARARKRDVIVWRVTLGCVAACFLLAAGELALAGSGFWQRARLIKLNGQAPVVGRVMEEQKLANRIDDLSTKRLLPLEMISIAAEKKPLGTQFLKTTTNAGDLNVLQVEAQTNNPGEIAGYKSALESVPACDKVEIRDQRTRDNLASFTLIVTFKPAALKPMGAPSS